MHNFVKFSTSEDKSDEEKLKTLFFLDQKSESNKPDQCHIPARYDKYQKFLFTEDSNEVDLTREWIIQRLSQIDNYSGLVDDILSFLGIAIDEKGFEVR